MKTRAPKKTQKPYWEMTAAELAVATQEFDGPIPASRMKPLSKTQRERFDRQRSGPAVNIFARPAKKRQVTIKLDERTLKRCEAYATKHQLTLSEVVNQGLAVAFQFAD